MKSIVSFVSALLLLCTMTGVVSAAKATSPSAGKINLHEWIDEAPGLPTRYEEALKQSKDSTLFQRFYDKVTALEKDVNTKTEAMAREAAPKQQEAMNRMLEDQQAKTNKMFASVGGMEKVSKMSREEKKEAALKMAQSMQQQQKSLGSSMMNSPGMQAMQRKMMNDPAYRERFENMSEKEQEAEMRQFMGDLPPDARSPQQRMVERREADQRIDKGHRTSLYVELSQELQQLSKEIGDNDQKFALDTKNQKIETTGKDTEKELSNERATRMAKIPTVLTGVGYLPDDKLATALNKELAERRIERDKVELKQKAALVAERKLLLKEDASKLKKWIQANEERMNQSADPERPTNDIHVNVTGIELRIIDLAQGLSQYSERVLSSIAINDENYKDALSKYKIAHK